MNILVEKIEKFEKTEEKQEFEKKNKIIADYQQKKDNISNDCQFDIDEEIQY